jgi:hypothetical protein
MCEMYDRVVLVVDPTPAVDVALQLGVNVTIGNTPPVRSWLGNNLGRTDCLSRG